MKTTEKENGLSYIRTSEWKEEVILFFHGFCGSKEYFPDSEFNETQCIVSFDRPGVGDSSVEEYYKMETFLPKVHEILKNHNVRSVKAIGHSAGGYYAQVFSQMYPDFVKSLSLVSSMIPLNCPKTAKSVNAPWEFITFMTLHLKRFSSFYFKKMAIGIKNCYEKQLAENLKTLPPAEKKFIEENPELIKNAVLNSVANDGAGTYHDAFALCQKREAVQISKNIPVFVWHGTQDSTTPLSFTDYFKSEYSVKKQHFLSDAGHMLYLPHWKEILEEILE